MVSKELQQHLLDMGINLDEQPSTVATHDIRHTHLAKGYFNDPRDANGEVPY